MPLLHPLSFIKEPATAPPPSTDAFSLLFNGSSQYGTIPAVLLPNADFTFECWVKLDSSGIKPIFSSSTDGSHYWIIIIQTSPNALTFQYDIGFGGDFISAGATLSTGTWYHIALTRSGNTWQWYIDGSASGSPTSNSVTTFDAFGTQEIAKYSSLYWPGRIDEIRIWDTARSSGQINANKSVVLDPGSNPNIIGYWRFEDGAGSVATDELGLNDATLIGTPAWSADVPF